MYGPAVTQPRLRLFAAAVYFLGSSVAYIKVYFGYGYRLLPNTRRLVFTPPIANGYKGKSPYYGLRVPLAPQTTATSVASPAKTTISSARKTRASNKDTANSSKLTSSSSAQAKSKKKRASVSDDDDDSDYEAPATDCSDSDPDFDSNTGSDSTSESETNKDAPKKCVTLTKTRKNSNSTPTTPKKGESTSVIGINSKDLTEALEHAVVIFILPQKKPTIGATTTKHTMNLTVHRGAFWNSEHVLSISMKPSARLAIFSDTEITTRLDTPTVEIPLIVSLNELTYQEYEHKLSVLPQFSATPLLPCTLGSITITVKVGRLSTHSTPSIPSPVHELIFAIPINLAVALYFQRLITEWYVICM